MALTGPRSVAISGLHPCSHWPLFAIAPTHEWIGNGAYQTRLAPLNFVNTLTESHIFLFFLAKRPFWCQTKNMATFVILRHPVTIFVTDIANPNKFD